MDSKRLVHVGKYLSLILRHKPEKVGVALEPGGWANIDDLLEGLAQDGQPLTLDELIEVVQHDDKQRFSFDDAKVRIRANQGHSIPIDLQLEPRQPPAVLLHGTADRFLDAILREGLKKMARHHVHLTESVESAQKVGRRRGKPVVLRVDAASLHRDGRLFYLTANAVWLVDEVPPAYVSVAE